MTGSPHRAPWIGVVVPASDEHAIELLGDAAELAGRLRYQVAVCTMRDNAEFHQLLIHHGADRVTVLVVGERVGWLGRRLCDDPAHQDAGSSKTPTQPPPSVHGPNHQLAGVVAWWNAIQPRIAFAGAEGEDRAVACRLAVRCNAKLVSPALSVAVRGSAIEITALNADGRQARRITLSENEPAVVTLRPGVGQVRAVDLKRTGEVERIVVEPQPEPMTVMEHIPADPATADIAHLPRLVAGGRGLGGREGFELLQQVAARLDAGIAASRLAVDLGWIERARQVGQTGKTVKPELYLAVGISGASHHREGMSDSRHIIALNNDPAAPIFQLAHLGLAADWKATLQRFLELTEGA